jgi:hypothetical protein
MEHSSLVQVRPEPNDQAITCPIFDCPYVLLPVEIFEHNRVTGPQAGPFQQRVPLR